MAKRRGRHTSTCKEGKKTIEWIQELEGVKAVILGPTKGRSGSGKVGSFKFQRTIKVTGSSSNVHEFKGVLTCSYGLQELSITLTSNEFESSVRKSIQERFGLR